MPKAPASQPVDPYALRLDQLNGSRVEMVLLEVNSERIESVLDEGNDTIRAANVFEQYDSPSRLDDAHRFRDRGPRFGNRAETEAEHNRVKDLIRESELLSVHETQLNRNVGFRCSTCRQR